MLLVIELIVTKDDVRICLLSLPIKTAIALLLEYISYRTNNINVKLYMNVSLLL